MIAISSKVNCGIIIFNFVIIDSQMNDLCLYNLF